MAEQLRILVADDEEVFRQVIVTVLRQTGAYEITSAESGEEVIGHLKTSRFDVLVLDYSMPEGSGLNVLQWMLEQKLDTPVIMLTGAGTENIAVEAMKLGAYDYIRKDHLEPKHLPIIINGVHERHLFRKERQQASFQFQQLQRTQVLFDTMRESISSLTNSLNNSLSVIILNLQQSESLLQDNLSPELSDTIHDSFEALKSEYQIINSLSGSLQALVEIMFKRLSGSLRDDSAQLQIQKEVLKSRKEQEL